MESIISDTNNDIDEKIKNETQPTHDDKKKIQLRIKQLEKRQQLHLFNTIIKKLDICTITDNGTYFDLNDLSPVEFWKLHYHINLTYDCINRNKFINELERQCQTQTFNRDLDVESASIYNDEDDNDVAISNLTLNQSINYINLREEALKFSDYKPTIETKTIEESLNKRLKTANDIRLDSMIQINNRQETSTLNSKLNNLNDSKVIERNIYTDKKNKIVKSK